MHCLRQRTCALPGASPNLAIPGGWGQRPQASKLMARWPHRAAKVHTGKSGACADFSAFTSRRVAAPSGATPPPHRQRRSIPALEAWPRRHGLCPRRGQRRPHWGGRGGYLHPLRGVAPTTGGDGGSGGRRSRPKRRRSGPRKA